MLLRNSDESVVSCLRPLDEHPVECMGFEPMFFILQINEVTSMHRISNSIISYDSTPCQPQIFKCFLIALSDTPKILPAPVNPWASTKDFKSSTGG